MDIVIVLMLTATLLALFILAWLPRIGVNSQIVFSVFGLGFAFVMALLIGNVTMTAPMTYPSSTNITVTETAINYVGQNQSIYYPNSTAVSATTQIVSTTAGWITLMVPDTYLLTFLYYGLGIALLLRFVGLTFIAMGKTINPRDDDD